MFQELFNDIKNATSHWVLTPENYSLKFWESTGTPSPKVGVALGVWGFTPSYSLTLSYTPRSVWCDSRAYFWLTPLLPFCLNSRVLLGMQPCNPFALVASPKLGLRHPSWTPIYFFCNWTIFGAKNSPPH
jgi:hypothetical protein